MALAVIIRHYVALGLDEKHNVGILPRHLMEEVRFFRCGCEVYPPGWGWGWDKG